MYSLCVVYIVSNAKSIYSLFICLYWLFNLYHYIIGLCARLYVCMELETFVQWGVWFLNLFRKKCSSFKSAKQYRNSKPWQKWKYCAFHVLVQTNFQRYYFYFLPDQAQILLDHFNVLDEPWGEISSGFDNRWRIFP